MLDDLRFRRVRDRSITKTLWAIYEYYLICMCNDLTLKEGYLEGNCGSEVCT